MNRAKELVRVLNLRPVQLTVLTLLLGVLTWFTFSLKLSVLDPDIFWHMAVGNWIVQHVAVPHTGIFSRPAADMPWTAYSWGYEVLISRSFAEFGLVGLGLFGAGLTFLVALSLFWSLTQLTGRFYTSLLLCTAACMAFLYTLMPRPVFFSMALYAVVLTLILQARRSGNIRLLYWLPAIFLVWANLHIQFIYGLFLVGLLLGVQILQSIAQHLPLCSEWMKTRVEPPRLPLAKIALVMGLCVAASGIGPYGFHLYRVVLDYSRATLPYSHILELQPLNFHIRTQYLVPLLTAAAFFALGHEKRTDAFKLSLIIISTAVSFRTVRDTWFICMTAVILTADTLARPRLGFGGEAAPNPPHRPGREKVLEWAGVATAWFVLGLLLAPSTRFNNRGLNHVVSVNFPVDACNYLRRNPLPGPMYNSFDWGGFLTWYLPMYPVSGDGRNDLYTDKLDEILLLTESEQGRYRTNPYLNEAGFLLVTVKTGLGQAISLDPQFREVYNDGLAAIYVRNE